MAEPIKFSMDEHVPRAVTEGLRRRGVDVLRAQETGMLGADDERHLAFALSEGRVIFTQERTSCACTPPVAHLRASSLRHSRRQLAPSSVA